MRTTRSGDTTVLPPQDAEALNDLSAFLDRVSEPALLLGPDGQQVALPMEVYDVLLRVVGALSQNLAITVAPIDQRLTTQQAANFLGVSRPTLNRYVDSHQLPHERLPGSRHRRIRLQDLLEFERQLRSDRRAVLDQFTRDAMDDGIYEGRPQDYALALEAARACKPID